MKPHGDDIPDVSRRPRLARAFRAWSGVLSALGRCPISANLIKRFPVSQAVCRQFAETKRPSFTPRRGCVPQPRVAPPWFGRANGQPAQPFQGCGYSAPEPRVAPPSQPWAGGLNPFGIGSTLRVAFGFFHAGVGLRGFARTSSSGGIPITMHNAFHMLALLSCRHPKLALMGRCPGLELGCAFNAPNSVASRHFLSSRNFHAPDFPSLPRVGGRRNCGGLGPQPHGFFPMASRASVVRK